MKKWLVHLTWVLLFVLAETADGQYATLTGNLQASNGLPTQNFTIAFTPTQWGFIAGTGVSISTTTYCATSVDGSVVGITNPLTGTTNTAAYSGGTLPAANYFVEYAWYTSTGALTLVSPETTAQLTAQGNLQVALPAGGLPAGTTGYKIYIGNTSGSETLQGSVAGSGVYLQSVPLVAGAAVPSTNNTICKEVANDAIWPVGTGYTVSVTDPDGNTQPGYPMVWQLLGPNTAINLSNGLPYYHGVVTYPVPVLASPLNHATQSISGGMSLGAYPMLAGSYGVNIVTPGWGIDVEGVGAKSQINAKGGYLVNGLAGTVGQCLTSDGYAYDTAAPCVGASGVTPATYTYPTIAVNAQGMITSAANGTNPADYTPITSAVAGAGAGTSPTITCTYCYDNGGIITVLTGSSPTGSNDIFLITFAVAHTRSNCTVLPWPGNTSSLYGTSAVGYGGNGSSQFQLYSGSTALAGTTTYVWTYTCTFVN